jgi:RNA polymerase sigma-70 factor (ECF subfamily)
MDEQVVRWPEQSVSASSRSGLPRQRGLDLSKLSDVELMACLKDGEQEALSHLFDRYHRLTLNIATRIVRDPTEAEDLMQDVFLAIYRVADRFDPAKGTVKNWIVQFTYHKSLNRRKYLALRGAFEDLQIREFDASGAAYSPSGSNGHTSDDVISIVREGMATLTPRQREVVELTCFEGFLLREIADRTKEPLGNVRHHYYRGIAKLREFVQDKLHPEESERAAVRGGGG